jgi:hypothetical protein
MPPNAARIAERKLWRRSQLTHFRNPINSDTRTKSDPASAPATPEPRGGELYGGEIQDHGRHAAEDVRPER